MRAGWGVVLVALAATTADPSGAAEPRSQRLTGEVFLGGATPVDPPSGEPARTHAYVTITGAAARRLYDAMDAPIVGDACIPGRQVRRAGDLTCSVPRRGADARCDFAMDLRRGGSAPGRPC